MLTVLTIEDKTEGTCKSLRTLLTVNSLSAEEKNVGSVKIRHLRYINRNGRIKWHSIGRKAKEGRKRLLYSGREEIPTDTGIEVFEPTELRSRLCANMGIEVLRIMGDVPRSLRVGVYDPEGDSADMTEQLLRYTDNLVVATKSTEVYRTWAQRLLDDYGAVLCISRRPSVLSTCGLIIAPCIVDTGFTPMTDAVVLTCGVPRVVLPCSVYYKYSFELPVELMELCAEGIDRDHLAGGLYSLCGIYGVGSVVPLVCSSDSDARTTLSLSKYLREHFST